MKDKYIKYVLQEFVLGSEFDSLFGGAWIDQIGLEGRVSNVARLAFSPYGIDPAVKYDDVVEVIIDELIKSAGIVCDGDDYAGRWYRLSAGSKRAYAQAQFEKNPIVGRVKKLGEDALARALSKIAEEDGLRLIDSGAPDLETFEISDRVEAEIIPASDRVVTLNHNQISEIDTKASELIEAVEKINGIDGDPSVRQIIIGQLNAGRELIRAGAFKLTVFQVTLMSALEFLAKKYEHEVVGALASSLMAALFQNLGLS